MIIKYFLVIKLIILVRLCHGNMILFVFILILAGYAVD